MNSNKIITKKKIYVYIFLQNFKKYFFDFTFAICYNFDIKEGNKYGRRKIRKNIVYY